jgi:hypothetical protein
MTFEPERKAVKDITRKCLLEFLVSTRDTAANKAFYLIPHRRLCFKTGHYCHLIRRSSAFCSPRIWDTDQREFLFYQQC